MVRMPVKKTYADHGDACRAANALDLVGDRWTLIVVRELVLGPKRFADLQEAVRGITPAVLTERLRTLVEAGIVEQVELPGTRRTMAYAATEWGRGLESVLRELGRWYSAGPCPGTSGGMTPDAAALAMRTMAREPDGAADPLSVTLRMYDARRPALVPREFQVLTSGGGVRVEVASRAEPAATVTADSTAWSEVLFGGSALASAERAGTVRVDGDRMTVESLVAAYAGG